MYLEIALKYKVKQSKNGKLPSTNKASPIYFEMQISLHTKPLQKYAPQKDALKNMSPRLIFGILQ